MSCCGSRGARVGPWTGAALSPTRAPRHGPRRRSQAPPQPLAFFGEILSRLGGAPSTTLASKRGRAEETAVVRRLLEGCRHEQALRIPCAEEAGAHAAAPLTSLEQQDALVAAALAADPSCAASNAVPFSSAAFAEGSLTAGAGLPFGGSPSSVIGAAAGGGEPPAPTPRAEAVRPILPCLFVAEGKLDARGIESLASQLALAQLQQLDFARLRDGLVHCLPDNVFWCGPAPFPSARVAAAATLHRMVARRGGLEEGLPEVAGSAIVLVYPPQDRQLAAEAVALYLYLYCNFDVEQAAKEAGRSMRASVQPGSLAPCFDEMVRAVDGWQRRVKLVWPYGGGRVELSGEAVGGWDRKVPLSFDVRRRQFVLWFWGLRPGFYPCKFIVDGRWCIDMAAPVENDSRGNANNVIVVPQDPPPTNLFPAPSGPGGSAAASPAGVADGGGPAWAAAAPAGESLLGVGALAGPAPAGAAGDGEPAAGAPAAGYTRPDEQLGAARPGTGDVGLAQPQQEQQPQPQQQQQPHDEEVVRFGGALLAFYTKLAVQRRVPGGH